MPTTSCRPRALDLAFLGGQSNPQLATYLKTRTVPNSHLHTPKRTYVTSATGRSPKFSSTVNLSADAENVSPLRLACGDQCCAVLGSLAAALAVGRQWQLTYLHTFDPAIWRSAQLTLYSLSQSYFCCCSMLFFTYPSFWNARCC